MSCERTGVCVCVFLLYKLSRSPSSVVFISLEIIVSTLLVCEVRAQVRQPALVPAIR